MNFFEMIFKTLINNILLWLEARPSRIWASIYIAAIPLFAFVYWLMPCGWFGGRGINGLFDSIYFSVITITTLGFGDVFPTNIWAKVSVVSESLIGIISIGLFLNEVAQYRANVAAKSEKDRAEKDRINAEEIRLRRQYVVLYPHIEQFIRFVTIVSTPIAKRKGIYCYNPDFPFQDLYDIYKPSLHLCDNFSEPAIVHFYKALHKLESHLEAVLQSVDFTIWPEIEFQIMKILSSFRKYDFESAIIGNIHMTIGDRKAMDVDSEMIRMWTDTVEFHKSSAINKYVALYFLIKETVPPLIILREHIQKNIGNESL